jgi:hypothetical protein
MRRFVLAVGFAETFYFASTFGLLEWHVEICIRQQAPTRQQLEFQNGTIVECLPGNVANETLIELSVLAGTDYELGRECRCQILEGFAHLLALKEKGAIAETIHQHLAPFGTGQEQPGGSACASRPTRDVAAQHRPPDLYVRAFVDDAADGAAGTDLEILAAGSYAQEPPYVSQIRLGGDADFGRPV